MRITVEIAYVGMILAIEGNDLSIRTRRHHNLVIFGSTIFPLKTTPELTEIRNQ